MVGARAMIGLTLAGAGIAVLCASFIAIDPFPATQPSRGDRQHPVAALAWSETSCESRLAIRPGTPRLQMEDLLELSADFDEMARTQGHDIACAKAVALAASVAVPATMTMNDQVALARPSQSP